jgi:hypothetical protein
MVRPRWHDALIIVGIVGVLLVGVWALWWADVRVALGWDEGSGAVQDPAPVSSGQT